MSESYSYKKLTIITGESGLYKHTPLHEAIIYAAKKIGMAGATAYKGIMAYGTNSKIRNIRFFELSQDLPIITEIVDKEDHIAQFIVIIKKMMQKCNEKGLITVQEIELIDL